MINSVKLVNFRNFEEKEIFFSENKNFIVGNNWKWKTNILEAISLLWNNSITGVSFENLTNNSSDFFFIEAKNHKGNSIAISYDKKEAKKKYLVNSKVTTKKKFKESTFTCVIFSPIIMNMMYLSPSLRRDFLDNILISSFPEYNKILKEYKQVVKNRNKLLKNINEWKSTKSEINFWNNIFIEKACSVYKYRFNIINYLKENISSYLNIFNWKIDNISFKYNHKIDENNIRKSIEEYLEKNLDRDIIIKKTHIWPHIDDFDVLVDENSITNFASRWETKSIILWLKKLEVEFIENITWKKPILIIDDLLSELDYEHEKMLLDKLETYQTFITSIKQEDNFKNLIKL